jgi:hypothetical protein
MTIRVYRAAEGWRVAYPKRVSVHVFGSRRDAVAYAQSKLMPTMFPQDKVVVE